ncbi:MAG: heavy-metal-associated domain-containing protein [Rhodococcus sp. (in: high G+C Gram-positive bacteria)]|jgi:copper chaperone CopZ
MATWTVPVSGLTCHRCVDTVTEQLTEIEAVETVSVDLVTGGVSTVTVTATSEVSDADLQSALSEGGAFSVAR